MIDAIYSITASHPHAFNHYDLHPVIHNHPSTSSPTLTSSSSGDILGDDDLHITPTLPDAHPPPPSAVFGFMPAMWMRRRASDPDSQFNKEDASIEEASARLSQDLSARNRTNNSQVDLSKISPKEMLIALAF
ncbi:hypothetical protein HDU97_004354 [Phlyctochytrium planicorne]|nr:hypothetical protein HDU97_004354 [Phlyctochytrium planicorne]